MNISNFTLIDLANFYSAHQRCRFRELNSENDLRLLTSNTDGIDNKNNLEIRKNISAHAASAKRYAGAQEIFGRVLVNRVSEEMGRSSYDFLKEVTELISQEYLKALERGEIETLIGRKAFGPSGIVDLSSTRVETVALTQFLRDSNFEKLAKKLNDDIRTTIEISPKTLEDMSYELEELISNFNFQQEKTDNLFIKLLSDAKDKSDTLRASLDPQTERKIMNSTMFFDFKSLSLIEINLLKSALDNNHTVDLSERYGTIDGWINKLRYEFKTFTKTPTQLSQISPDS